LIIIIIIIIQKCLYLDACERPSCSQLLQHRLFNEEFFDSRDESMVSDDCSQLSTPSTQYTPRDDDQPMMCDTVIHGHQLMSNLDPAKAQQLKVLARLTKYLKICLRLCYS